MWSAIVVPVPLFALSLMLDGPGAVGHALAHPTLAAALSTAYTVYMSTLLAYGIWNSLLARYPAAAVVPFTMLVPVVGAATAWVVLREVPNGGQLVGGLLLLAGVATTTGVLRARRHRPSPESPSPGGVPREVVDRAGADVSRASTPSATPSR